jgi:hypothetical protein
MLDAVLTQDIEGSGVAATADVGNDIGAMSLFEYPAGTNSNLIKDLMQRSSGVPLKDGRIFFPVQKLLACELPLAVEGCGGSGDSVPLQRIQFSISGTTLNFAPGIEFLTLVCQELIRARQDTTPLEGLMSTFDKAQWHYFFGQHYQVVCDYPSAILRSFGGQFDSSNDLHGHMLEVFADELGGKIENGRIFVKDRDSKEIREVEIDWSNASWRYSSPLTLDPNSTVQSQLLEDPYAPPHSEMMGQFLDIILEKGWRDIGVGPETTTFLKEYGDLLLRAEKSAYGPTVLTVEGEINFPAFARSMYGALMVQDWVQERIDEFRRMNPSVNPNIYWDIHLSDDLGHGQMMMNQAAQKYPSPTDSSDTCSSPKKQDLSDKAEQGIWLDRLIRRVEVAERLVLIFSAEIRFEQGLSQSILNGSFRNHLEKAYGDSSKLF